MRKNVASICAICAAATVVAAAFVPSAQAQRHAGARGVHAGSMHPSGAHTGRYYGRGYRVGGYYGRGYRGYGRYGYRYGHRYPYRYGYRYRGGAPYWGWGLAAGALAAAPYYYNGGYAYGAAPAYDSSVAYCIRRFRSYDPASGTYLGYDGRRHPCP